MRNQKNESVADQPTINFKTYSKIKLQEKVADVSRSGAVEILSERWKINSEFVTENNGYPIDNSFCLRRNFFFLSTLLL